MKKLLLAIALSLPLSVFADNFYVGNQLAYSARNVAVSKQRNFTYSTQAEALRAYWSLRQQNLIVARESAQAAPAVQPREFWINYVADLTGKGNVCEDLDKAMGTKTRDSEVIHVREVIE